MSPRDRLARLVCLAVLPLLVACAAPPVRVDFADYQTAPQKHADDDAIIRTDLATLLANAKLLKGRRVELRGRLDYRGLQIGFNYWHFYLVDDQGHRLRAYEHEYRITQWAWADSMARLASQKHTTVTVGGRYEWPDLELDWFDDGEHRVDTDYLPMRLSLPWRF